MEVVSVTVGVPVADLATALDWYRRVLELDDPDLEPADGVVEFRLGGVWLQLGQESPVGRERDGTGTVLRLGVRDVAAQRERLRALGVAVGPLEHVPGAVDYVEFADPDGNRLSLYTELDR